MVNASSQSPLSGAWAATNLALCDGSTSVDSWVYSRLEDQLCPKKTVILAKDLKVDRQIITSAEEGGYVFGSVCLSVCPSDYSQTCERILTKFFIGVGHGSRTKWYNFGGDLDHASDPGVQSPKSGSSGLLKKLQTDLCHAVFGGGLCSLSASSYYYDLWLLFITIYLYDDTLRQAPAQEVTKPEVFVATEANELLVRRRWWWCYVTDAWNSHRAGQQDQVFRRLAAHQLDFSLQVDCAISKAKR